MELGNSNSVAADYCLVYNYYSGNPMPSSCAAPTGTSGSNNGSILGSWYQDNVNTGYSHKWTYNYDAVGRLSQATATDFSNNTLLSQPYNYTSDHSSGQYGNMTCSLGGSGYCPQVSFDASTNRVTSIGSLTATYDATGDMTYDGSCSFQYDAEGRVNYSSCPGQWQYPMYNALGQRVRDYQGSATDTLTLTYPRDIFGQRTGAWAEWPSQSWIGWNVYWSQIAGQRLNMGGTSSYLDHSDAVDSTTMETDQTGAVVWDTENYPWGLIWQQTGTRPSGVFAGLDWQVNDPSYPSDTREYDQRLGRWMTPDPLGMAAADPSNPQSWNRYAYVLNNPTTLTDPTGLCDLGGEHHNWLWCAAHALGLVDTQHEAADDFRTWLAQTAIYRNGERVDLNKESDQSVISIGMQVSLQQFDANRPEALAGFVPKPIPGYPYMEKPNVTSRGLQDIVDDLFQETDQVPGGTAGAVRYERSTGNLLSRYGHVQDAQNLINRLNNFLVDNPGLSVNDQAVAKELILDLQNSLKGQ